MGVIDDLLSCCVSTRPRSMDRSRYPWLPFSPLARVLLIGSADKSTDRSIRRCGVAERRAVCNGFRFILIAVGSVVSRSQISRRYNTQTCVSLGVHEVTTHCIPRRHWRNHLSMSAPRADIPRRKWSLAGGIDDRRLRSGSLSAPLCVRISSHWGCDLRYQVFHLFLDLAAVARKVFHLIVIFASMKNCLNVLSN